MIVSSESFASATNRHALTQEPARKMRARSRSAPERDGQKGNSRRYVRQPLRGQVSRDRGLQAAQSRGPRGERLLVFDVREGWVPLYRFLEVPIPDQPFPLLDDTATTQAMIRLMRESIRKG